MRLLPCPRLRTLPQVLAQLKLLQWREGGASRRDGGRRRLRRGHLEVQHAVFDRTEVTYASLVERGSRAAHGVAQVDRSTSALRGSHTVVVATLRLARCGCV